MLVEITLQFIRAEHPNEEKKAGLKIEDKKGGMKRIQNLEKQQADTLTVNASACEFMELILKQV